MKFISFRAICVVVAILLLAGAGAAGDKAELDLRPGSTSQPSEMGTVDHRYAPAASPARLLVQ